MTIEGVTHDKIQPDAEREIREEKWAAALCEVEQIADTSGRGIDEGVKETIAAFNVNGIETVQSCEGHDEVEGGHRPWPWVEVGDANEPAERFENEANIMEETSREHGVDLSEFWKGRPEELYWETRKKISGNPETAEYLLWRQKNEALHTKVTELLGEFNSGRGVPEGVRLKADESEGGSFEVGSEERPQLMKFLDNELTDEEKSRILQLLPERQAEMRAFTDFLKQKFFGASNV